MNTYHIFAAAILFQTQLDIALVVNGWSEWELMSRECHVGLGDVFRIFEGTHNVFVNLATVVVDQGLLRPTETISNDTVRHFHAIYVCKNALLQEKVKCENLTELFLIE